MAPSKADVRSVERRKTTLLSWAHRSVGSRSAAVWLALIGVCVVGRLIPHAPNFAPVTAAALFAGMYFSRRTVALLAPLTAMAVSDAVIGVYDVRIMISVYLCFALAAWWGDRLKHRSWWTGVPGYSIACSSLMFLVTNLAYWRFSGLYLLTADGLWQCYQNALPFFRNQMLGDLFWSTTFFGAYVLLTNPKASAAIVGWDHCPVRRPS